MKVLIDDREFAFANDIRIGELPLVFTHEGLIAAVVDPQLVNIGVDVTQTRRLTVDELFDHLFPPTP